MNTSGPPLTLKAVIGDQGLPRAWRHAASAFASIPGSPHAEALELVVDELVANAVLHGIAPFEMTIQPRHCSTIVEVTDSGPATLFVPHGENHRGLAIVHRLSCQGPAMRPNGEGKTVRAVVPHNAWNGTRCPDD